MTIDYITSRFKVWEDKGEYVVTATKENYVVFRGTKAESIAFIERHPYGMTLKEAKEISQM